MKRLNAVKINWLSCKAAASLHATAFTILTLFTAINATAEAPQASQNEFIVKFASSVAVDRQNRARSSLGVQSIRSSKLTGTQLVKATAKSGFNEKLAKDLLAAGIIEYFEPNYIYTTQKTPNDTSFAQQWGLHNTGQNGSTSDVDIDAPEAWNVSTGSNAVVVGVVDTGVNYQHPDLTDNLWINTGEIPGNGIDDDANGVIDDVHGYNAILNSGNAHDDNGHGSHVAGIMGAASNNQIGVSGTSWDVQIMALKFLNSAGSGTTQSAIDAIEYAVMMKNRGVNIKVLNNSWGGSGSSQALRDAISAANNAGIMFIAAAGNSAQDNDALPTYPANYDLPNVLSVAAVDSNGNLANFSNYGRSSVDVAAPGVSILSTTLGNSYVRLDGTSMATPYVSGIVALLFSYRDSLSVSEAKARIVSTTKPLSSLTGLMAAPGIASAYRALTNQQAPTPTPGNLISYAKDKATHSYESSLGEMIYARDDGYVTKSLNFSFSFFGEDYSQIAISANGRILPLKDNEEAPTSSDFSNRISSGIIPLNDDLYPSQSEQGGIWFKQSATTATITWVVVNYAHRNSQDAENELRFQVKISKSGNIKFHYADTFTNDPLFDYGASASIGIAPPAQVSGQSLTVSHNLANITEIGSGKSLSFSQNGEGGNASGDFDGDGKSDIITYRPSLGLWFVLTSSTNFDVAQHNVYQLGLAGDLPLLGDFDGDSKADMAVWRSATGSWFIRHSSSDYGTITEIQWGLPGDLPLVGDYDGDGKSDLVIYRIHAGTFHVLVSSAGFNRNGALSAMNTGSNSAASITVALGGLANDPVVGDFTGDGKDDFATIWQLIRFWTIKDASGNLIASLPWGEPGDTPLACAWDDDAAHDRAIVRVKEDFTLNWFVATSAGPVYTETFGSLGDLPNCNRDYDGDGRGDMRVFRTWTGEWFIKNSKTSKLKAYQFGLPGDVPL